LDQRQERSRPGPHPKDAGDAAKRGLGHGGKYSRQKDHHQKPADHGKEKGRNPDDQQQEEEIVDGATFLGF